MPNVNLQDFADPDVCKGMIQVLDAGGDKLIQASENFMSRAGQEIADSIKTVALCVTVAGIMYMVLQYSPKGGKRRDEA
jgi:hypothetical protein